MHTGFWWVRLRCGWEDNIKIDLYVVDWEGMD